MLYVFLILFMFSAPITIAILNLFDTDNGQRLLGGKKAVIPKELPEYFGMYSVHNLNDIKNIQRVLFMVSTQPFRSFDNDHDLSVVGWLCSKNIATQTPYKIVVLDNECLAALIDLVSKQRSVLEIEKMCENSFKHDMIEEDELSRQIMLLNK
jgi:hypothetical protein